MESNTTALGPFSYRFQMLVWAFIIFFFSVIPAKSDDCKKLQISDFPKTDLPTDSDKITLKDEQSSKYYYGIGVPINYVKARKIAFLEMETANGDVFSGAGILMMIYANGYSVPKNLELALSLACGNVDGAQAEIEIRTAHLKKLEEKPSNKPFDICDDITSGYMDGWCANIRNQLAGSKREADIRALTAHWLPNELQAFRKLQQAAKTFFDTRVENEVDLSGTSRAAFQIEESSDLDISFLGILKRCEAGTQPIYSTQEFIKADQELNAVYQSIVKNKAFDYGTVQQSGIRKTEKAWLIYRDSWVRFGKVKYPKMYSTSFKTFLTSDRITQLKTF